MRQHGEQVRLNPGLVQPGRADRVSSDVLDYVMQSRMVQSRMVQTTWYQTTHGTDCKPHVPTSTFIKLIKVEKKFKVGKHNRYNISGSELRLA